MRRAWALLAIVLVLAICSAQTTYKTSEGFTIDSATGALLASAAPVAPTWKNSKGLLIDATGAVVVALSGGGSTLLTTITTGTGACGATCVGTGADVNMYTYQIPAATIGSGKGVRLKARWRCSTCTAVGKVHRWVFGATTLSYSSVTFSTTTPNYAQVDIFNNPGVTNAQTMMTDAIQIGGVQGAPVIASPAENTANAITVNFVFNAAGTETMTPILFTAEVIQ
jgi:hypothetical protein